MFTKAMIYFQEFLCMCLCVSGFCLMCCEAESTSDQVFLVLVGIGCLVLALVGCAVTLWEREVFCEKG